MRVQLGAYGASQHLDVLHESFRVERGARDKVGVAANVLRQGVQREVRAVFDRSLKDRAEKRVVARDERRVALSPADRVGDATHHRDVNQTVGWIRRGFSVKIIATRPLRMASCAAA
jgi:hypothetical protein